MANIAQMVNVLQAMILTDGPKMLLTPTFYVFEMYKVHHDAALIPLTFVSPEYELNGQKIPAISASASRDKSGAIHVTVSNADPHRDIDMNFAMTGLKTGKINGRILTAKELTAHNTFDNQNVVKSEDFKEAEVTKDGIQVKVPAKSIIMLEMK
jgi:alpha-L-arabinofuranosidase